MQRMFAGSILHIHGIYIHFRRRKMKKREWKLIMEAFLCYPSRLIENSPFFLPRLYNCGRRMKRMKMITWVSIHAVTRTSRVRVKENNAPRGGMTSLNSRLNIREPGTLITSFRTILPAWGAVFSTTPAITEEASLERLDSPSGVFDQSFALDDNGTDIHCAKVQRESARYIADCLRHDFEKPVDPIERRIQMFATRRLLA